MAFIPNSRVYLIDAPLDTSYKNQLHFGSRANQQSYFQSKVVRQVEDCSYIRHDNAIRVGVNIEKLWNCNYVMYQNENFSNRWFYAFITRKEFVNNEMTHVFIETDVYQTWIFDCKLQHSFVEREHVSDDSIGANLLDEGLALGDYVTVIENSKKFTNWWICIGSSVDLKTGGVDADGKRKSETGYVYGGIYSGISWYCFDMQMGADWVIPTVLRQLTANGVIDGIVSMFMIPKDIVSSLQSNGGHLQATPFLGKNIPITTLSSLDGYTPKNKKLLTYPYRALNMSNKEGNTTTLRYEFFKNKSPIIHYRGGLQPNSKIVCYPVDYKGVEKNLNESISVGNFPQCCWQKDNYMDWLSSQQVRWGYTEDRFFRSQMTKIATGGIKGAVGGAKVGGTKGAVVGAVTGSISETTGSLNSYMDMKSHMAEEKEVHSMIPNSVKGSIGNGYSNITFGEYGFHFEQRTITSEVAQSIDEYFDMYGYKVNRVKVPNISNRPYWNYVKTTDINIDGSIPSEHMVRLKSIFNNGVTIWKGGNNVGNYNLDNR